MKTITVDADALNKILEALNGPPYLIQEIMSVSKISGSKCPIKILTCNYIAEANACQINNKNTVDSNV